MNFIDFFEIFHKVKAVSKNIYFFFVSLTKWRNIVALHLPVYPFHPAHSTRPTPPHSTPEYYYYCCLYFRFAPSSIIFAFFGFHCFLLNIRNLPWIPPHLPGTLLGTFPSRSRNLSGALHLGFSPHYIPLISIPWLFMNRFINN